MFKEIERNNDIFHSALFLKDAAAFNIMLSILGDSERYPAPKIFSNSKNCAIVNSDAQHAVIVWTANDFQEYDNLYDFIKKEFGNNIPFKIMAKKDFYDYLVKSHQVPKLRIQTLGVYTCPKLNDIPYSGHPDHAKSEEVQQIAQMLVNFGQETGEYLNGQVTDYIESAREFISNPMYGVWRDKDEKVVAIAAVRAGEKNPRLGKVYTNPTARGKSYAKMLVHYLSSQVLKSGKTPMLFTDYDYEPSNRCYQAVGYELNCTIVNFAPPIQDRTYTRVKPSPENNRS